MHTKENLFSKRFEAMRKDSKDIQHRKLRRIERDTTKCGQEKDNGLLVIKRISIGDVRGCRYHAACDLQIL